MAQRIVAVAFTSDAGVGRHDEKPPGAVLTSPADGSKEVTVDGGNKNPAPVAGAGSGVERCGGVRAYSPSALATNGGLTSTPVCSGAV